MACGPCRPQRGASQELVWCAGKMSRGERTERPFQLPTRPASLRSSSHACAGFWDPIGLAKAEFWDNTNEETIGWLRHAEIRRRGPYGLVTRVRRRIKFPGRRLVRSDAARAGDAPRRCQVADYPWRWLPEWWSEIGSTAPTHEGGKPATCRPSTRPRRSFPTGSASTCTTLSGGTSVCRPRRSSRCSSPRSTTAARHVRRSHARLTCPPPRGPALSRPSAHPVPRSSARCLRRLGIFGFLSAQKIEGSVPLLKGVVSAYAGDPMVPF